MGTRYGPVEARQTYARGQHSPDWHALDCDRSSAPQTTTPAPPRRSPGGSPHTRKGRAACPLHSPPHHSEVTQTGRKQRIPTGEAGPDRPSLARPTEGRPRQRPHGSETAAPSSQRAASTKRRADRTWRICRRHASSGRSMPDRSGVPAYPETTLRARLAEPGRRTDRAFEGEVRTQSTVTRPRVLKAAFPMQPKGGCTG